MLVEFSIQNYLSFNEKVTLSLVASSDSSLPDRLIRNAGGSGLDLLKAVAILGANASGKSNLLQAITFAWHEAAHSGPRGQAGAEIERIQFALSATSGSAPTRFAIVVVGRLGIHRLEVSVDDERYLEERFSTTSFGRRERVVYERRFDQSSKKYDFRIGKDWMPHLKKIVGLVRPNASVASVAASFGSELLGDFVAVLSRMIEIEAGALDDDTTAIPSDLIESEELADFARIADPRMRRIRRNRDRSAKDAGTPQDLSFHYMGLGKRDAPIEVEMPQNWVSEGTLKMVRFYAPFIASRNHGALLLIDELESHLHPLVSREVLHRYFTAARAGGGGQMIFTTHDTELLDTSLLRRDQVYLIESDDRGASHLTSIWDFREDDGRQDCKEVDVRARYLAGRYGGIPIVD